MLRMPARQIGYPVLRLILVKPCDRLLQENLLGVIFRHSL
jgi:hypothetical protein